MTAITKVEDIEAWQEARKLASEVYGLTSEGRWAKDFGLRDQIRRASVSVACNIAEGYARESNIESRRFLSIARGSATEVKTQMYIALDLGYVDKETFGSVYARLGKICQMITNFMRYLQKTPKPPTANRQLPTKDTI